VCTEYKRASLFSKAIASSLIIYSFASFREINNMQSTPKLSDAEGGKSTSFLYDFPADGQKGGQSTGSLQSKSIASFEVEDGSSTGGASWRLGMPWFRNSSHRSSPLQRMGNSNDNDDLRYYGGLMKSQVSETMTEPATPKPQHPASHPQVGKSSSFVRNSSQLSRSSRGADSIGDFDSSDWTQPDSAYGAACPVCGWVPKHVRRMIEVSLITGMAFGFVYLVVTTSMHINNERNAQKATANTTSISDSYNGGQIALDDDLYVEYNPNNVDDGYYADDATNDDGGYYTNNGYDDAYGVNSSNNDATNDDAYANTDDAAAANDDNAGDDGGSERFMLL
jgi:hypothetical protein